MFILDFGSGNTCKNDFGYIQRMIDTLAEVDPERKCIIKWQLFEEAGNNIPLSHANFISAYKYATTLGFETTASVFDKESLNFLLQYNIPFVKIANNTNLYWLIGKVPREIPIVVSVRSLSIIKQSLQNAYYLSCISKYPASSKEYKEIFPEWMLEYGISDHTTDWGLFKEFQPKVYECHFKLFGSTGLDAGPFARTPEQIKEIYNLIK